jgi:hypothetical protein
MDIWYGTHATTDRAASESIWSLVRTSRTLKTWLNVEGVLRENGTGAKLTIEHVRRIYELANDGETHQRDIGKMFGVSASVVCNIKNEKSWQGPRVLGENAGTGVIGLGVSK